MPHPRAIGDGAVAIAPAALGVSRLYCDGNADLLFTENESNPQRLWNMGCDGYYKDAFHERIVGGHTDKVNPSLAGTKAGVWFQSTILGGGMHEYRLRLSRRVLDAPFGEFEDCMTQRRAEADRYYADLQQDIASADERMVQRQAFAGLIWSKQFYHFEIPRWLKG